MTRSIVMRMLAAASAVAVMTSLSAQSAPASGQVWLSTTQDPAAPPKATAQKARAEADRVQVRLAEVMAMLEEDEMSPELQQKALAKLAEVAKRLREERAADAPRATSLGGLGGIARVVPAQPPTPDSRPVFGTMPAFPSADKAAQVEALGVPMPSRPAKAPKPPKAPKVPKEPGEPAAVPGGAAGVVIDTDPLGPGRYRVYTSNGQSVDVYPGQVEVVEKAADTSRAVAKRYAERRAGAAEANDEVNVLLQRIGKQKAQAAEEVARARDEAEVALQHAKAAQDEARANFEVVKRARSEGAFERARAETDRALNSARARVDSAAPVRTRTLRSEVETDDAEIRATIEEMRAEMREIRQLMQEIRRRAQSEEQVEKTTSSAFGGFPGAGSFGSGSSAGSLPAGAMPSAGSAGFGSTSEPAPASAPAEVRRVHRASDNK